MASLLFDAGQINSPALLQIGEAGSNKNHAANPTSVQDVYFRIGGAGAGRATQSLIVNSSNTLIDHIWAWRADHGAGAGWTSNTADTGVLVNGNNVTAYGLFVEHYQKHNLIWNGNGGRAYFFQNEMPYDPPSQSAWRNDALGYAAYKVGANVTIHQAWGIGAYCYFNVNPAIHASSGVEVPNTPGVKITSALTVSLAGTGTIDHVVNSAGAQTDLNTTASTLVSYP
ncbi:hypothetical protein [Deinococcus roseus]|uniref:Coagulation factor 5/8 type domain-containing protein n=1 Tax=Deinococcus roseus TaxID=392414 RepID=A0ABQ2D2B6_9DEIO|nr:hypothetical protein [Deinococcus roseus]GGJ43066.1 hypothetical protein GCM10008938_31610 [Deinococcus roseus]